jgi:TPR repeat protein
MSHPYRMQLSGTAIDNLNPVSDKTLIDLRSGKSFEIKPHQIMAKQQLVTNTKKSHPFLQQLPTELSKSLESLHISSPHNESFNQIPSTRGSTTSNSSKNSIKSTTPNSNNSNINSTENSQTNLRSFNGINGLMLNNEDYHNSNEKFSYNELNDDNNKTNTEPKLPNILLEESEAIESNPQDPVQLNNYIPDRHLSKESVPENNNEQKGSSHSYAHQKSKSTANLIHPVFNTYATTNDENNSKSSISKSTVSLLPLETSLEMYRQNSKKTKDPNVLFSFAQLLIKTCLSKRSDNPLTQKEKDQYLEEAFIALKKSSKSGCIEAQYYLGDAFSVGLFNKGKPDLSKSLTFFESAGKARHAESAYRTAMCYKKGWGCTRDARKVVKFLEIAAINNHPVAMMEYGIYAFHGLMSFPEDINTKKKGISWLRRATECATELSCGAPYELALIYINGFKDLVIKDTNYAIKLLFKAANLGHAKSAAMLGKFYEIGDIVESNSDLSIHFYNLSANMGDVEGMMGLCSWYFVGSENLPQDYDEAFAWALRAAENHKHQKAMLLLERFYERGVGCEKDLNKSKYWGDLARAQNNKKK